MIIKECSLCEAVLLEYQSYFRYVFTGEPSTTLVSPMLTDAEKQQLLTTARQAIDAAVRGKRIPPHHARSSGLESPGSAFVTLRVDDELRGCIGYIEPIKPLIETVQEVAVKAALEDFRFNPVQEHELQDISIEISVLSALRHISDIHEIEVGKHGILMESRGLRGLLLPQVAVEQRWDRETFLTQTARKAGLPPMIWQQPNVKIFIFTAEIFHEVNDTKAV